MKLINSNDLRQLEAISAGVHPVRRFPTALSYLSHTHLSTCCLKGVYRPSLPNHRDGTAWLCMLFGSPFQGIQCFLASVPCFCCLPARLLRSSSFVLFSLTQNFLSLWSFSFLLSRLCFIWINSLVFTFFISKTETAQPTLQYMLSSSKVIGKT